MLPPARCPVVPRSVYTRAAKAIPIGLWVFPAGKTREKGFEFEVLEEVRLKIA
jgi:hypothetical protein